MFNQNFDQDIYELLMQDSADDEVTQELIEKKKIRRVYVAS